MKRLTILLFLSFFVSGCYQASLGPVMNIAGPAAGATQGRVVSSTLSTGINYGIKHSTGKYPIEHVLKREKDKIVKKVQLIENTIENEVKESSALFKNKIKNQTSNSLKWVLHLKEIKTVKQEEVFPANKPRYSYWSEQK